MAESDDGSDEEREARRRIESGRLPEGKIMRRIRSVSLADPFLDLLAEETGADMVVISPPYVSPFTGRPVRSTSQQARDYTEALKPRLAASLSNELETETEWLAIASDERRTRLRPYVPRMDLVAGAFAGGYDYLLERHRDLVERMIVAHKTNVEAAESIFPAPDFEDLAAASPNPRCFLAVEIERALEDPKHLFASAAYAAMWGKVGIVVCWSARRLHKLLQIRETMALADSYKKNSVCPANLLILSRGQMDAAVGG